jgi:hypothetical protein
LPIKRKDLITSTFNYIGTSFFKEIGTKPRNAGTAIPVTVYVWDFNKVVTSLQSLYYQFRYILASLFTKICASKIYDKSNMLNKIIEIKKKSKIVNSLDLGRVFTVTLTLGYQNGPMLTI